MGRHWLPTRDRTGFTAQQVSADYAKAFPSALEEIGKEFGTEITIVRQVGTKTKFSHKNKEQAVFSFKANLVYGSANRSRDFSVREINAITAYVPSTILDKLKEQNPEFEIRANDLFNIQGALYRQDSSKPYGTFLDTTGEYQYHLTTI